jgi:hypothetical protein
MLTLTLMAVGESAHTYFQRPISQKGLQQKNGQKLAPPQKMSAESMPLKNRCFMPVLCLRTGQSLKNVF